MIKINYKKYKKCKVCNKYKLCTRDNFEYTKTIQLHTKVSEQERLKVESLLNKVHNKIARGKCARKHRKHRKHRKIRVFASTCRSCRGTRIRLNKYGLRESKLKELLDSQKNKCDICKNKFTKLRSFCIDHCHSSKKVRGLLCTTCNTGLGHFSDNYKILNCAVSYLKKHKGIR